MYAIFEKTLQIGTPTIDIVKEFKCGIEHNISQFPTLKDDNTWDNWNRSTVVQARAQDIIDVLDPVYIPSTAEDIQLFWKSRSSCMPSLRKPFRSEPLQLTLSRSSSVELSTTSASFLRSKMTTLGTTGTAALWFKPEHRTSLMCLTQCTSHPLQKISSYFGKAEVHVCHL